MKIWSLVFVLTFVSLLPAQIQIDILEPAAPVSSDKKANIAMPESGDHSVPAKRVSDQDMLHFLSQDRLSGQLIRIDAAKGLVWKHPDAASELLFGLENLKAVTFRTDDGATENLLTLPQIELTNGDRYRGRIVSMDSEKLVIETPLAGPLQIRSDMVQNIRPVAVSTAIFEGPNSIEEWELNNNGNSKAGWEFKNGALYSSDHNMMAGLDLNKLTDKASIEFKVKWRGNVNLLMAFWGKDANTVHQNCYVVAIQNGYIRSYRNFDKIGRNELGNVQGQNEMNKGELNVKLLLNREKKEVIMLFDDKLMARWNDSFDGEIKGNALVFGSMSNTPIKISNISVREWDGDFNLDRKTETTPQDQLITVNGDIFAGQLEKIEANLLHFKNDFAVFQVPVERISEIKFAQSTRSIPRLQAGDTEIVFPGGERITLKLASLDGKNFRGSSESTGEVTLLRKYFVEMKLNPYDDRQVADEEGDW